MADPRYTLDIEAEFCAAHALVICGVREPVHGHNWHLTVTVGGDSLDDDGLLCDFHTVEDTLGAIIEPLHNTDLNTAALLAGANPTAELVAERIGLELSSRLSQGGLGPHARVLRVRITEAPGCAATRHFNHQDVQTSETSV